MTGAFYFGLAVYLALYEEALLDVNTHNLNGCLGWSSDQWNTHSGLRMTVLLSIAIDM